MERIRSQAARAAALALRVHQPTDYIHAPDDAAAGTEGAYGSASGLLPGRPRGALRRGAGKATSVLFGSALLLLLGALDGRAGTFSADFNSDPSTILNFAGTLWDGSTATRTGSANWQKSGGAGPFGGTTNGPVSGVANDGFLQITMANVNGAPTSYLMGGVLFDDFDHGLIVAGFTFDCDLRIGNGNPNPADGFSISYVRTNDPIVVALNAGDTLPQMNNTGGSPNGGRFADNGSSGDQSLAEEGTTTGLSIGFDMWDSNNIGTSSPYGKVAPGITHDGIGLDIRVDGVLLTEIPMPNGTTQTRNGVVMDEYGATVPRTDPNGNNAATDPTAIETGPYDGSYSDSTLKWVHLKVNLSTSGVLNVYWKNKQILTNFQTSYFPSPGRLLMAARVGGNTANIEVDNIQITTVPANGPVLTGLTATPGYVDFALLDQAGITVDKTKPIMISIDGGAAVAPTSTSYTNNTTTLHLANAVNGYYAMGSTHSFNIALTDSNGSADTYPNKSFTVGGYPFNAVNPSNFMVEGPDFNFGGGQFIDNVVLSSTAGPNNYLDKVGTANIDEYDPAENGANHAYRSYDATSMTGEMVGTEPVGTTEAALRSAPGQKYDPTKTGDASIVPYDVGWVDVGEWYNFTRTFPAGKFRVYSRLSSGNGGNFTARIDAVLSSAAAANQTTGLLGYIPGYGTGGWQNYQFFPLVDAFNNELVLPIGGKETFRFTTVAGGLNLEFFSFVPSTDSGTLLPYVGGVTPRANASGVNPAIGISATIVNRDTSLDTTKVSLALNGSAVTPTITPNALGATVAYTPPALLPLGSTNTVQLVYSDKASAPNSVTNRWSFVVISASAVPFTMPVSYALPANSGQTPGFPVRVIQIDQGAPQVNSTAWSEAILAGAYPPAAVGTDNPQVINYLGVGGGANFGNDADFNSTFNLVGGNNFALESDFYLALQPGVYTLGVNSDDGFRVTTGQYAHQLVTMPGAEFNGGRGPANTFWTFLVQTNGLYPFRLTYEEGGGGYEVEFFSRDDSGKLHLINDPNDSSSIKAFHASSALPSTAIQILQAPTNVTVDAYTPVTFSVMATTTVDNASLLLYEWTLSGTHLAYGRSYTIPAPQAGDAGTYTCTITYLGYAQSQVTTKATLTVNPVTTPPNVARVAAPNPVTMILYFNRPVDAATAGTAGNYTSDGGLSITAAALDSTDPLNERVILTTSAQTAGTVYHLTINGVKDTENNVATGAKVAVAADVLLNGYIESDHYEFGGIGNGLNAVSLLTGNPAYPYSPTLVNYLTSFNSYADGTGNGPDNDARRMIGYFLPDTTDNYNFFIRSDDASELWISTDDTFANLQNVAAETGCCNAFQEPGSPRTTGTPLAMTAGQKYAIMALQKNGVGGDYVQVAFRKSADTTAAGNLQPIPAKYLATLVPADGYLTSRVPTPNTTSARPDLVRVVHLDTSALTFSASNVQLWVDNAQVTPTFSSANGFTAVTYIANPLLAAGSSHTAAVVYTSVTGASVTNQWSFVVGTFPTITPDMGVVVDTSKPGFFWNMSQVLSVGNDAQNSNQRTEDQLAGLLGANVANPAAAGAAAGPGVTNSNPNLPISFVVPGVINFAATLPNNNGNFTPDLQMPGSPGTNGGTDNQAAEIITFVNLPAGVVVMGVNSDDGFKATAGPFGSPTNLFLGQFNGGRGASDTWFTFIVQQAGIYPLRVIWENGGGGSNIELFSVDNNGNRTLVNDTANGGFTAYRVATGPGSSVPPAGPKLTAAKSGSNIVISWTTTAGFNLMSASSLTKPITWSAVSQTPTVNGTTSTVTVPIGTGNQFFQLAK